MTFRLVRIQNLVLSLTAVLAVGSLVSGLALPLGIVLGGAAAWLDFVVIRSLASAMLVRRPSVAHVVPMALAKSFVLVAIPGCALWLPSSLVDGVSFAIGVTTLPLSVVVDAMRGIPEPKTGAA